MQQFTQSFYVTLHDRKAGFVTLRNPNACILNAVNVRFVDEKNQNTFETHTYFMPHEFKEIALKHYPTAQVHIEFFDENRSTLKLEYINHQSPEAEQRVAAQSQTEQDKEEKEDDSSVAQSSSEDAGSSSSSSQEEDEKQETQQKSEASEPPVGDAEEEEEPPTDQVEVATKTVKPYVLVFLLGAFISFVGIVTANLRAHEGGMESFLHNATCAASQFFLK